jgi:competence ComEA-like helix-hairpin-helix protein
MKKNWDKEEGCGNSEDYLPQESTTGNIPVFLVLATLLLATIILSSQRAFLQKNIPFISQDSTGKYVWVSGFPEMVDGLYPVAPGQYEKQFPAILNFPAKMAAGDVNPLMQAFRFDAGLPQREPLPPQVANLFWQPIPVNRADADILTSLPGIGPVLAERIVQHRKQHGPFRLKNDLLQVEGIGAKKFAALVDHITLD